MSGLKQRTTPMEVLVLGLCRTGTMSMRIALEKLGYTNVYHFSSIFEHQSHPDLWTASLKAKFEQKGGISSDQLTREGFDNILGGYNAVTDIPCACFAPELITAYPSAKLILTTRSEVSWQSSMMRTIHALQTSYLNRFLLLFSDPQVKRISSLMDLIITYYFRGSVPLFGVEVYEKHNEMVRAAAKAEGRELLEFQLGDGWEKLCGFLGKPVPHLGFPHVNERDSWRRSFGLGWSGRNVSLVGLPVFVAVVGAWVVFQ
ncbi:putative NAD dependent epimerase/dehydratase [Leptodontidium sp. MPI-SDFR-AT-0119]|nr:putative NAD dependent epimerase/dehydratase [Leptodontidium sp. MPI-SDFR-AT-0119]